MNCIRRRGSSETTQPGLQRLRRSLASTALGLLAAIPAVIFYNKLSADSDRIISGYDAFADEFATILSRQLDAA